MTPTVCSANNHPTGLGGNKKKICRSAFFNLAQILLCQLVLLLIRPTFASGNVVVVAVVDQPYHGSGF